MGANGVTPISVWVGIVPGIIDTGLPIRSELGYNGSAYINGLLGGLGDAAFPASEALWNRPGAAHSSRQSAATSRVPSPP